MIRFFSGTDLWLAPILAQSMFKDRAIQFSNRLKWKVDVDLRGYECDEHDALNPIYVVVEKDDGSHAGSLRLLPTTGRTTNTESASKTMATGPTESCVTWECTRFCLSPSADCHTSARLISGAGRLLLQFGAEELLTVIDASMLREFRNVGFPAEVFGKGSTAEGTALVGRLKLGQSQLKDLIQLGFHDPLECELALVNSSFFTESESV